MTARKVLPAAKPPTHPQVPDTTRDPTLNALDALEFQVNRLEKAVEETRPQWTDRARRVRAES